MEAPIHNLKPFATVRPTVTGSATDVARHLRPSPLGDAGRYASAPPDDHTKLENETRTWVAQTFFGTLLKQMRNSPFKSDLFSGGRGGEAFGSLYDQQLAERMANGVGSKLVDSIVRKMEAAKAYRKTSKQVIERTERSGGNNASAH